MDEAQWLKMDIVASVDTCNNGKQLIANHHKSDNNQNQQKTVEKNVTAITKQQ